MPKQIVEITEIGPEDAYAGCTALLGAKGMAENMHPVEDGYMAGFIRLGVPTYVACFEARMQDFVFYQVKYRPAAFSADPEEEAPADDTLLVTANAVVTNDGIIDDSPFEPVYDEVDPFLEEVEADPRLREDLYE
jgi:hypothetical protein